MLRAVCVAVCESPAHRDSLRILRAALSSAPPASANVQPAQTVLSSPPPPAASAPPPPPAAASLPPPPGGGPRRAWPTGAAVALAVTASLGGVYMWNKKQTDVLFVDKPTSKHQTAAPDADGKLVPAAGAAFPKHVQFLVAGGGTAAFAALRALRAATPDASILLVSSERALPYMRPPLSKEIWREPALANTQPDQLDNITFTQWNGRRRPLAYEPEPFYTPVERLHDSGGGGGGGGAAAVARGWTVTKLDVTNRTALLTAPGHDAVTVSYDACLIATGSVPRRVPALAHAAAEGRSLTLRTARDAIAIAARVDRNDVTTIAVIGGGFIACELASSLADRHKDTNKRIVMVLPEPGPMAAVLPHYLQEEAARRLQQQGVTLIRSADVTHAALAGDKHTIHMTLSSGDTLHAHVAIEAVGAEPDVRLAAASGLELHPLGGVVVNAELQARHGVWAAGDAACYHDMMLGRRREQHHDHAVLTGRLAAENMAAIANNGRVKAYNSQSMFWSDLGPKLGYEAIGVVDSRLPTVAVFSEDAVTEAEESAAVTAVQPAAAAGSARPEQRRYARGVVFYMRDARVVGVLLWNLFNRMHVARQVLAHGEFDDLMEVGKLFAPHEEE